MAGIELGAAYISILPETKDFDKKLTAAFNNAGRNAKITPQVDVKGVDQAGRNASARLHDAFKSDAVRRGEKIGTAVGTVIGKGVGIGITGAIGVAAGGIAAAVGGIGYSLTKGFERIKTIDQAKFKLKALGKTSSEVEAIMRTVTDTVTGTPFSLDAAFGTAVQAIGAGTKDIKGFMTSVADAAGFAGTDIDRMGLIFNQVLAKGKLTGEEMMQLMEAGLPAKSWIMDSYNLTSQQFEDMQANGEITLQMLQDSVDKHAGGMSKKLGESLQGSLDNLKAAAARTGASIITALSGGDTSNMTKGVDSLTAKLDELNGWITQNSDDVLGFFANIGMVSVTMAQTVTTSFTYIIRSVGWFVNTVGDTLGGITKALSGVNRLLGRDEIADQLAADAESMFGWGDALLAAADNSDKASKALEGMFFSIGHWKGDAQQAAQFTTELGKAVKEIAGKDVLLKTPKPEELAAIDQAKWKILEIPDSKDVIIRPKTAEAAAEINAFREKEGAKPVVFMADPNMEPAENDMDAFRRTQGANPVQLGARVDTAQADADVNAFLEKWRSALSGGPGGSPAGQNPLMIPLQTGSGTGPLPPGLKTPSGSGASFGGGGVSLGKQDSGGVMQPLAAETKRYFEGLGYEVGGYSPADSPEDEHQTGEATDIMVPSIFAGNALLGNVLTRPGVQYVIWNNKMWYPDGSTKPYSGPSPHTDHLHVRQYDQGGLWPSGTVGINTTGKDEYVLTPEQIEELRKQGIDPTTVQHGTAQGRPPGPTPEELEQVQGPVEAGRTEGYVPAGAGFTGATGGGVAGSLLGLGESAINGLIDQAASAASAAGSTAANAFAPGSGMAADAAIQMGAQIAKRGVQYGFDMAEIGIGALTEQFFPFGAPRWLSDVDPTSFMPQLNISPALTTTGEKAIEAVQQQSAVDPMTTEHGAGTGAAPGPVAPTVPQPLEGVNALSHVAKEASTWAPPPQPAMVNVENINATDAADVGLQIAKRQRLEAMRFAGRP